MEVLLKEYASVTASVKASCMKRRDLPRWANDCWCYKPRVSSRPALIVTRCFSTQLTARPVKSSRLLVVRAVVELVEPVLLQFPQSS
eukprot:6234539-Amphidinium_carterae.3